MDKEECYGEPSSLVGGEDFSALLQGLRPVCMHTLSIGEAAIPNVFDGSKFKLAAPEPHPKRGGVLRYGILSAPAHFDVHQSGTVSEHGEPRGPCTIT